MARLDDLPRVEITDRRAWRRWLERHHADAPGVWLITYKQGGPKPKVPWPEIVDEALCFGWVDSLPRKLDEARSMLLVTPRKPRSVWSAINKRKVARLIAQGRMTAAGLAKVEAAKRDGSWAALDEVERGVVPDDLAAALATVAKARGHWDAFPPGVKKGILQWIASAKRPQTRAARVAETARLAGKNQRANDWKAKQRAGQDASAPRRRSR